MCAKTLSLEFLSLSACLHHLCVPFQHFLAGAGFAKADSPPRPLPAIAMLGAPGAPRPLSARLHPAGESGLWQRWPSRGRATRGGDSIASHRIASRPVPAARSAARLPAHTKRVGSSWKYGGEGGFRHFAPALPPAANKGLQRVLPAGHPSPSLHPPAASRVPPPLPPPLLQTHRPPPPERDVPAWGAWDPLSRRGPSLPRRGHGPGPVVPRRRGCPSRRPAPPPQRRRLSPAAPPPRPPCSRGSPGRCAHFPGAPLKGGGKGTLHG